MPLVSRAPPPFSTILSLPSACSQPLTLFPSLYSVLLALPPTCSLLLPLPLGSLFGSRTRWPSCTSLAADTSLPQREPPLLRLSPVSARPLASPCARNAPGRGSSQSENSSAACATACTRGARSSRCAPRSPQAAFGPRARVSLQGEERPLARPLASTVHITLFAPERWPRARDTGYRPARLCTERPPPEASHKVRTPPRHPLPAALYTCPGACRGCTFTSSAGAAPLSPRTPQKARTPAEPENERLSPSKCRGAPRRTPPLHVPLLRCILPDATPVLAS